MPRRSLLVPVAFVLCSTSIVQAATLCVAPEATGAGDGSDWSNAKAWGEQPARGDTWYLADGEYPGMTFDTPESGASAITIKKATQFEHGPAAGWNDELGNGQAIFTSSIFFESSHWVFDGQTGGITSVDWRGAPTVNWHVDLGFKIVSTDESAAVIRIAFDSPADDITIRHVDLEGMGSVSNQGGSYSNDGIAIYGASNITVGNAWIHGVGRCPFFIDTADSVFEKIYVESYFGSAAVHSELASIWAFAGLPIGDITFRHNLVTHIASTGGLMFDNSSNPSSHLYVYGNVFYQAFNGPEWEEANGVIGGWTGGNGEEMHNVWVFNNTFVSVKQATLSTLPNVASGSRALNNVWYASDVPSFEKFPEHDYNHFIATGDAQGEAHGTIGSSAGDVFYERSTLNFLLWENTEPGLDLGPPFDVDALGHQRKTWTRGAYEFCADGSCDSVPTGGNGGFAGSGTGGNAGATSAGGTNAGGAGGTSSAGTSSSNDDDSGCGCRTTPARTAHWLFLSVVLGLFLARRRRD